MSQKKKKKNEPSSEYVRARDYRYFFIIVAVFFVAALIIQILPLQNTIVRYIALFLLCFGGIFFSDYIYDKYFFEKRKKHYQKSTKQSTDRGTKKKK